MELELELKLTRAKDGAGPLFLSRETETMFILTAHLKGYKRGDIKIDINEDGTLISISGDRQVKQTVMVGWKVYKKDTETKGFKKVFRIPDGVILDKIKADHHDDDSTLTITMPKNVKGIRGTNIEKIKEKRELVIGEGSMDLRIRNENENSQSPGTSVRENDENAAGKKELKAEKEMEQVEKAVSGYKYGEGEENVHDLKNGGEDVGEIEEIIESTQDVQENNNGFRDDGTDIHEEETEGHSDVETEKLENEMEKKKGKICIPVVAGSALLVSFMVFVFQMIRSRNLTSRKRD
ncbi:hypothetical protein OROMI_010702 [Orobanche minor]